MVTARKSCVFLMYHEIELPGRPLCQSDPGYVRYILPLETFRRQMAWIKESGWQGLNVGEALRHPVVLALLLVATLLLTVGTTLLTFLPKRNFTPEDAIEAGGPEAVEHFHAPH